MTRQAATLTIASALAGLAVLVFASPSRADEPEKARCAAAYERAQELQQKEALRDARKQLVICSDTCPGRFRKDCLSWIADVDALMPTIVLRPRDPEGRPIRRVRVTIDGELLAESIEPDAALAVDPGTHVLRFEHPELVPADVRLSVHGAERKREVAITLWRRPDPVAASPQAPAPAAPGHRSSAYVFGAFGFVAMAAGGGLAIAGHVKRSELSSSCAPYCSQGDADTVVALWRYGGVAALVGAASLGVGAYLWFLPPADGGAKAARARRVWLGAAGMGAVLGGSFE